MSNKIYQAEDGTLYDGKGLRVHDFISTSKPNMKGKILFILPEDRKDVHFDVITNTFSGSGKSFNVTSLEPLCAKLDLPFTFSNCNMCAYALDEKYNGTSSTPKSVSIEGMKLWNTVS